MAGKKYRAALEQVDSAKVYDYKEAIALAKKISTTKFDSSLEASFVLNVDPRQGAKEEEAKAAGADFVGGADMIQQIQGGWFDFDIIVATPDMMGQLGKLGKLLGPKGLMPNPKTGTVTMDVAKAIDEIKKGKVEYRVDKDGNINVLFGKVSFTEEALVENFKALYDRILKARPVTVKGAYLKGVTVSTTMGPGIKVTVE